MRPPGPLPRSKAVTATPFLAKVDAHTAPETNDPKKKIGNYNFEQKKFKILEIIKGKTNFHSQ